MIEIIMARVIPKTDNTEHEEYYAYREILNMDIDDFIDKMKQLYPDANIYEDIQDDWDIIIGDEKAVHLYINAVKADEITFDKIASYADEFVGEA